ncbi:MAG: mechanosensitive ion channel [Planctomycetes bacterium]|nr:mechanosensitive ion channel [Planctomycetota bacterium]
MATWPVVASFCALIVTVGILLAVPVRLNEHEQIGLRLSKALLYSAVIQVVLVLLWHALVVADTSFFLRQIEEAGKLQEGKASPALAMYIAPVSVRFSGALALCTWTMAILRMLWKLEWKLPTRIGITVALLSVPLISAFYPGGIARFLTTMSGLPGEGSSLSASSFVKSAYAFVSTFVLTSYYAEVCLISHKKKPTEGVAVGLDPESYARAMSVVCITMSVIAAVSFAGANLSGLGLFSGLVGAGLSFALRDLLNNVVAGLILAWDKSIKTGDVVELADGFTGEIKRLSLRFTQIRNRDQIDVLVPNSVLISKELKNLTHEAKEVRLDVDVRIKWDDFERAAHIAEEACLRIDRVLKRADKPPKTFFVRQGDGACDLRIAFWINTAHKGISNVKSDVFFEIMRAFKEANIELPLPHQAVHVLGVSSK